MSETECRVITRIAELEIDTALIDPYKVFLTEEIAASLRLEPGVLMLNAVAIKGRPELVRIMEVYADQKAYEAHLQSPHFLKYKTKTVGMVKSLNLIDVEPIALNVLAGVS
ncbi:MAG: antibiotic biosynthesis monooxygenase family protein [Aestuariivirga sp.]